MSIFSGIFTQQSSIDYKQLIKDGARIVDVRSKEEFASGHVKGAINVPLETLETQSGVLGKKDGIIIAYCASGGRSGVAVSILQGLGFEHVYNGGGLYSLQKKLH